VTHLYRGHGGPVSALCFNFPAQTESGPSTQKMELLTGSVDTRVRLYDLRDNTARTVGGGQQAKPKAVLEGHVSVVRGLAVSEDGRWVVSGGRDRVVLVWDLLAGGGTKKAGKGKAGGPQVVQTIMALEQVEALGLLKPSEEVCGAEEGRLLCYTAGDKGMIRVWDVLKATEVVSMAGVEGVEVDEDTEVDEDEQRGVIDVL
jgi:U3 small nucleolar RNA-associated protein 13